MTAFDRIEPQLPQLMDELAAAQVPDYFSDMLLATSGTRQRPAWSSLGRWLPTAVAARTDAIRFQSWRPLLVIIALGLLVAAAGILAAGAKPKLPPPFGQTAHGVVVFGTESGDIRSLDLATGATADILTGATLDRSPRIAPDGTHLAFLRGPADASQWQVANLDGSGVVPLALPGHPSDTVTWSPTGDRLVVTPSHGGVPAMVHIGDGTVRALTGGQSFRMATWRPGHDQLILSQDRGDGGSSYFLIDADGTNLTPIPASLDAVDDPAISPDGASIAYVAAKPGTSPFMDNTHYPVGEGARPLHLLDLATGADRTLTTDQTRGYLYASPQFSPDGSRILVDRHLGYGHRLAIVPADGSTDAVEIGPALSANWPAGVAAFAPDGTAVLVTFAFDRSTWLLPADGEPGQRLDVWLDTLWSWQPGQP